MNLSYWFNHGVGGLGGLDSLSSPTQELAWAWATVGLSALIALGYGAIAINWYFQSKVARQDDARAALRRLRGICLICGVCGGVFYATDVPWPVWRFYNLVLLVLVWRTWGFLFHMKGWSLVDERLKQVKALERSAAKYRELAELLPNVVWTATGDGRIDYANRRWRDYTGGDDRTWIDALHPDERPHVLARWGRAIAHREPLKLEARLAGAGGGAYRAFVVTATPITHGQAVRWLGACADVEDQRLLAVEKELQARQKSFFLNALSHDLRAPLHNVLLNAHLLKMAAATRAGADPAQAAAPGGAANAGTAGGGPAGGSGGAAAEDDLAESIEMIMENAVAAGDLVARLLDFAKVGAEEHNQVERVGLRAALNQIARRFQPVAEKKQLYLRVEDAAGSDGAAAGAGGGDSGEDDLTLLVDRHKLQRIVSNLVDNAIKYTQQGGVTLSASLRPDGQACVRVADTGIGIPPASVAYLFDEFYQVNNYERDRSKGFGMGLAICQCLARHLGGDVRLARSTPGGGGSVFELLLPAAARADRGGRPLGPPGDVADPQAAGVCGV